MDMQNITLLGLRDALNEGKISSLELVNHYLERIEKINPKYNIFVHINADEARKEAKHYDDLRAKGEKLPEFAGIPVGLKDLVVTKSMPTTCASPILEGYYSPYDATIVNNMKAAGYIMLGKLNMDQFAMGSSGATSCYGPTLNPWNEKRVPGGSSSGSAAAVAARLLPLTIGSDTGGSIRQPSGWCGVTGMKPTYGRVSRYGVIGYSSSLDQIGPIAKNAEDAAIIMDTLALHDPLDSTSMKSKPESYIKNLNANMKGVKLGLPAEYLSEHLAPCVRKAVLEAVETYKSLGAEIVNLDMRDLGFAISVYQIVAFAEVSSSYARFDGIEFGPRADTNVLDDVYTLTRDAFGSEVKKRIIMGTYFLQKGHYENYYIHAMKLRRLIRREYDKAFTQCDALIGPTSSTPAFEFGTTRTAFEMYLNDIFTVPLNLCGGCGISIPCGFSDEGMPIGLQIQSDLGQDQRILNIAHAFQQATDWHKKTPEGIL